MTRNLGYATNTDDNGINADGIEINNGIHDLQFDDKGLMFFDTIIEKELYHRASGSNNNSSWSSTQSKVYRKNEITPY